MQGAHAAALKAGTTSAEYKNLPKSVISDAKASSDSASYLGKMYWRGEGVKRADPTTARQWFERGVEWNSPGSQACLGYMIQHGEAGFEKDHKRAKELYTLAAAKNDGDAQTWLGEMFYQSGNFAPALKYFTMASRSENVLALYRLGIIYSEGLDTTIVASCEFGVSFWKNMAEKADWDVGYHREAQEMWEEGDIEGAFLGYALSAEMGVEESQINCAWIVDEGWEGKGVLGETVDSWRVALTFWNRAANQGNVDARVKMGDYHFEGLGMENDTGVEGESENPVPTDLFGSLLRMMFQSGSTGASKPDYAKAALYYQVAAESEHSSVAMYGLAYMHEHGFGVPKDLHLAKRYYDNALTTNPSAFLPVNLSLMKLWFKMIWSSEEKVVYDEEKDVGVEDLPPVLPTLDQVTLGSDAFEEEEDEEGLLGNVLLAGILVFMVWRYGMGCGG
jgi:SEL1 protein